MKVRVNGEDREIQDGTTVNGLLHELSISLEQVAVEINLEILEPSDLETRKLCEGDRIEIMSFIGGGQTHVLIG